MPNRVNASSFYHRGGGRIGVNQDRDKDTFTMAQGTHLHLMGRVDN